MKKCLQLVVFLLQWNFKWFLGACTNFARLMSIFMKVYSANTIAKEFYTKTTVAFNCRGYIKHSPFNYYQQEFWLMSRKNTDLCRSVCINLKLYKRCINIIVKKCSSLFICSYNYTKKYTVHYTTDFHIHTRTNMIFNRILCQFFFRFENSTKNNILV